MGKEETLAKNLIQSVEENAKGEAKHQALCEPELASLFDKMFTASKPTAAAKKLRGKMMKLAGGVDKLSQLQVYEMVSEEKDAAVIFEDLDPALKNVLASKKMEKLIKNGIFDDREKMGKQYATDPVVRLGLSLGMTTEGGFCGKKPNDFEKAREGMRRVLSEKEAQDTETLFLHSETKGAKKLRNTMVDTADGTEISMKRAYENARNGKFSAWANLPPYLQDVIASKEMHRQEKLGTFQDDAKVEKLPAHDPALRLGLSLAANTQEGFSNKDKDFFRKTDADMTQKVFLKTFEPVTNEAAQAAHKATKPTWKDWLKNLNPINWIKNNLIWRNAKKESKETVRQTVGRNEYSQRVMLKMMYAGQIGQSQIKENGKIKEDAFRPDGSDKISDMFTAGGRTGILLPGNDFRESNQAIDAIYGLNRGYGLGNDKRWAATHGFVQPDQLNKGKQEFEELKLKGPSKKNLSLDSLDVLHNQYGINIAAGGLGSPGTDGKPITNKGCCGHLYSRIESGSDRKSGTLLVGIESDAPGKGNYQGHTHTSAAIPESTSCFGAQKTVMPGDKYSGRVIDARGVDVRDFTKKMKALDEYVEKNQRDAREPEDSKMSNLSDEERRKSEQIRSRATENLKNLTAFITGGKKTAEQIKLFEDAVKTGKDIPEPSKIKSLSKKLPEKPIPGHERSMNVDELDALNKKARSKGPLPEPPVQPKRQKKALPQIPTKG